MKSKRIRPAIVLVIIIALIAVVWWGATPPRASTTEIVTSGFIEGREITVAAETGGRITAINADEGDRVVSGGLLVSLDDALLKAQQQQAQAAVNLAEAASQQAAVVRDGARLVRDNARDVQNNPLELDGKIVAAEGALASAELDLVRVRDFDTSYQLGVAQIRSETARKVLDNLQNFEGLGLVGSYTLNKEIYPAQGELQAAALNLQYQQELARQWSVQAAELRRDNAAKALQNLQAIRENPQAINATVDQAEAAYRTAEAAVTVAARQVEQARANLALIQVQLAKLSVRAPLAGVVVGRFAEPGEIAQPGAPILKIVDLSEMTLTAYVPEGSIGRVTLGETVSVAVDSYPGVAFSGEVTFISPQAVFTPKNVQLKEEREKTVFAVKVRLPNPEQKLKPGMPADARILTHR